MSLPSQFALFVMLIALGAWLVFYKALLKLGRKIKNHVKKIKNEIGRDEE